MASGRTDERDIPTDAKAPGRRESVWGSLGGTHLGQRSHVPRQTGRTHDRTRTACQIALKTLAPRGPFSNRLSFVNRLLLAAVTLPGSRFSPRSAFAAATSGSKHRRCNVHNGLTCKPRGPTASLAVSLHPRPGGQLAPAPASGADGSCQDVVRPPLFAPTSGTARRIAKCCAGSPTACGPTRHVPCRDQTASRSPAPSPSTARPA